MPFNFYPSDIEDVQLIKPRVFPDDRGYFLESYKRSEFVDAGIEAFFVQDNHSLSGKGTLRGIHYQLPPHSQGKLVRVLSGAVYDVAVDLRRGSSTFGRWVGYELSAENNRMLYIPPGFGHAFLVLRDNTHFVYKCTAEYNGASEGGVRWDDPELAIPWPIKEPTLSEKDSRLPLLRDAELFD